MAYELESACHAKPGQPPSGRSEALLDAEEDGPWTPPDTALCCPQLQSPEEEDSRRLPVAVLPNVNTHPKITQGDEAEGEAMISALRLTK